MQPNILHATDAVYITRERRKNELLQITVYEDQINLLINCVQPGDNHQQKNDFLSKMK